MTADRVRAKLEILNDNLDKTSRIPHDTFKDLSSDFRNVDSAQHRLQTSIQALMDLGGYLISKLGLAAPRSSREILETLETAGRLPPGSADRFGPIFGF